MKSIVRTFSMFLILVSASAPAADFSSWSNMMGFRFAGYNPPGGATPLTNFPALVVLSTNLPGFRYTDFNSTNADLRFTDSTTTNELNYQIESWDTNGSSYVWVQVPRLVNTNSHIWAFWGKSGQPIPAYTTNGATWSEGYLGVWHMTETNVIDSTSHRFNSASHGNTNSSGLSAGAQGFTSGTWLQMDATSSSNATTLEAWVKHTTVPATVQRYISLASEAAVIRQNGSGELHFYMVTDPAATYSHLTASGAILPGIWYHVAGTWNGAIQRLLKNGSTLTSASPSGTMRTYNNGTFSVNSAEPMDGLMDEIRISSVARSSNWLWACWLNMASNSTFALNGPALYPAYPKARDVTVPAEGSTTDLFDVSRGTKVFVLPPTITETAPQISDVRDMLGASRSTVENKSTLFATGTVNQTRSLSFRTASHIILTNFQLRVVSDDFATSYRTISSYKLSGSADNITYALIASNAVGVPYNLNPGVTSRAIMISGSVMTLPYQFFTLEIRHGFTDGPRIIEFDGFGVPGAFAGVVRDPIVFNDIRNTTTTNIDEDPGYASNITSTALYPGYIDARQALGAAGGIEGSGSMIFNDYGIIDNGNLTMGDGGETIHSLSWKTTQPLTLAGICLNISYPDRPSKLIRFSVNNIARVFKSSGLTVINVPFHGTTNLLFTSSVTGTNFLLEMTSGTSNGANVAMGPRIVELDALLYFEPQGSVFRIR